MYSIIDDFLSLERSSAFQARQMRSLFGRFYDLGSHYKGEMKKYQEAKEVNHRRKTNLVDKLDESKTLRKLGMAGGWPVPIRASSVVLSAENTPS